MTSGHRRAVIVGGTGAMGGATARRLAERGWSVDVTGRSAERMPSELVELGVRFHELERENTSAMLELVGDGADLLVDLAARNGADVLGALPIYQRNGSIVLASSRAVYVDSQSRHINGDDAPCFAVPIAESNKTLAPAAQGVDSHSREGYAPSKAALEQAAADSGLPISVIRPSKVHGRWARNARTRSVVDRMLAGEKRIELAHRGNSIDHLTAAANAAALIEVLADLPAARVVNIADPDPLTSFEIVEAIALAVGWQGQIVGLDEGQPGGGNPWNAAHPIVLDTSYATHLGYEPAGTGRELIADEATWIAQ